MSQDSKYLDLSVKKVQKKNDKDDIVKNPLHQKCIIPNHVFRCGIISPSGGGKTNLMISMLTKRIFYKNYFNHIIIFSPTAKNDDNYKKLKETKQTDISYIDTVDIDEIKSIMTQQKEIINKVGISKSPRILLIFDDVITDKNVNNNQSIFVSLFTMGRHLNFSIFLLSQSYMKIPKTIRLNLTNLFILSPSQKEIKAIAGENINSVISEKDLENLIRISTLKPYDFFHINKQCEVNIAFRHNFDNIYEIYD